MTPHRRHIVLYMLLIVAIAIIAVADLLTGTTSIPAAEVWRALMGGDTDSHYITIIRELRIPKIITALLGGMALAASGLQMQTLFRNPLAGPYVLGISSGASLGVALFTLALPMMGALSGTLLARFGITGMAWLGSAMILMVIASVSRKIKNINTILIVGMMLGSAISAVVGVLQYMGSDESLKAFVVWSMGSLSAVTTEDLYIFVPAVMLGIILSVAVIKPLNTLLLGEGYARTMGMNIRATRRVILLSTTLLAGSVTAFCGPIAFVGLAMPHMARMTFRTADHKVLMPASMLWGAVAMLLCCLAGDMVAHRSVMLPINTVTALLGIPIIIFVVLRNRNRQ